MTNNQQWFNKEFSKNSEKIEIEYEDFEGTLIVEDYPNLTEINIADINKAEEVVLKNLHNLKDCAITNCKLEKLIIEECSNIKDLNVHNNLLTNLEFAKNLTKLSTLAVGMNKKISSGIEYLPASLEGFSYDLTGLSEVLKLYENNWKLCKEDLLKIKEIDPSIQDFLFLQKKHEILETKYKNLKNQVLSLLNHIKKGGTFDQAETKEIMFKLESEVKELKISNEKLEKELAELKEVSEEKERTFERKREKLTELKRIIISNNKLKNDDLEDILEDQEAAIKNSNEKTTKKLERAKKRLASKISEDEVNQLCQFQTEITCLEIQLGKIEQQIVNIHYHQSLISGGDFSQAQFSGRAFSNNTLTQISVPERLETAIEQSKIQLYLHHA